MPRENNAKSCGAKVPHMFGFVFRKFQAKTPRNSKNKTAKMRNLKSCLQLNVPKCCYYIWVFVFCSSPVEMSFSYVLRTFSLSCMGLGAATSGGAKQVAPALQQQNNRRNAGRCKTTIAAHSSRWSFGVWVRSCVCQHLFFHPFVLEQTQHLFWYLSEI